MSELIIDGSYGEGGGQILRSALALSIVSGKPFTITNIRAGRKNPGLAPQHLVAVQAAAAISGADAVGAERGSTSLQFRPGPVRPGRYELSTGTAGSTSLVFHSIFPALAQADATSELIINGGTHVPWSPPFDHLSRVFLPTVAAFGLRADLTLVKCGYYPRGGGEIRAVVHPREHHQTSFSLESPGRLIRLSGVVGISNIPTVIATRIAAAAASMLRAAGYKAEIEERMLPSPGQGVYIFLCAEYEHCTAGFSSLGERGKRSEAVAREAVDAFLAFHRSEAAVEPHLADQLLLPAALSGGHCSYTVSEVTQHLRTNAWVVQQFLPVTVEISGEMGAPGRVVCTPLKSA